MKVAPALLTFLSVFSASGAIASPWTLPQGYAVFDAAYNYQLADSEFFDEGGARVFPLNGEYTASTIRLAARFGFTDRLELEASLPLTIVSYTADSVILLTPDPTSPEAPIDFFQRNIIDLNRTTSGVGDIRLAGRYRWMLQPLALATEVRIKAPTGYDGPSGTFGDSPKTDEEFLSQIATVVTPERLQDDVTLGDAQLDIAASMLAGYAFHFGLFARLDLGYNLRLGGAADQIIGAVKVGQLIGSGLLLFAGARLNYSIETGRIIGVSVAAIDPELPADQYGGTNNLLLREVELARDNFDLELGAIFRLSQEVELNATYSRTMWGRNTSLNNSVTLGFAVQTDITGGGEQDDYEVSN